MGVYKQIAYAAFNAASDTSLTSIVYLPPDFTDCAIKIPGLFANATAAGIRALFSNANTTTTFTPVYFPQNEMNIKTLMTTNMVNNECYAAASIATVGGFVVFPILQYSPGYVKFQCIVTATANTGIAIYGRSRD